MNEKDRFGKKPVRRSKSDENEPARVYKPRTASRPEKQSNPSLGDEANTDFDSRPKRTASKKTFSKENPREEKGSKSAPLYKPRTAKNPKERVAENDQGFKKTSKPEKSDSFQADNSKGNYYQEKFGKKKQERPEEKFDKPRESKIIKKAKTAPKQPEFDNSLKTDKEGYIRINKYIANSGLCSRREADEYIQKGYISINGEVVKEVGTKVKLTDEVCYRGKKLDPEKKVYILLNKPKDYVTTVEDPNASRTVMDLIVGACDQRVYPVGRLDRNSTGLLLFTNDGELTTRLTHPSFMKKKIYEVGLDKSVKQEDMNTIRTGVEIEGEMVAADAIEYVDTNDKSVIGIEIHSGQNRIVRKIFEKLGYRVYKLDRVYFAGLTKKNLPRGKWRFLTPKEVNMLKMNRF